MQIKILAFLFFFQPLVSCQQSQDKALLSEASIALQSGDSSRQCSEKPRPTADNIVFQSVDGGETWQDVSAGLPKGLNVGRVLADGKEIFLASDKALYHSSISATAPVWENEPFMEPFLDVEISGLFSGQTGPYVTSYRNGLYQKIAGTGVFMPLHNTLKDKTVRCVLETPDGTLFIGCESGIYKSADGGKNWKQVFSGEGVNSLVEAEGVLISGNYKGLMRSTDGGEHWDYVLTEDGSAWRTEFIDGRFVTITQGGDWRDHPVNRLRMSADGGKTWQRMDESLLSAPFVYSREMNPSPLESFNDIKKAGKYLFCSSNNGIFRSSDWGKSWEPVFTDSGLKMLQLAVSGNVIYAVKVIGC